jgi:tetratricopeptide (TPR) repeat protein
MLPAVNDTIIVCRPEQMREAAMVLSCCTADCFTPLIVFERPPHSEEEYRRRYEWYVEARDRRDALAGAPVARAAAAGKQEEVDALNKEVDRRAETLTTYRSWWRHQRQIGELLRALPLRRAVFLFAPEETENGLINALPKRQLREDREPVIPETIDWAFVLPNGAPARDRHGEATYRYRSLAELTDIAWRACGRSGDPPAESVEVPEAERIAYVDGLWRALGRGVPLRTGGTGARAPARAVPPKASEAVLVEFSDHAEQLMGAQYAHHRKAKLVVYAEPTDGGQESLRMLFGVPGGSAKAGASRDSHDTPNEDKFLAGLREFFFGDADTANRIRQIERAVSVMVPDHVVEAVGDLDLTVFTSGLPYNFVRKGKVDWSSKAIGHVAGDTSLLILTEMCWMSRSANVGFTLLFDPVEFGAETRDVLEILKARRSYPLVLSKEAGSSLALLLLGPSMPIDMLFFNTHGDNQTIKLSDGHLPAFKIVQRQTLASRPFIFNSSCLSWVGVGREFVRTGARGYVGTLWPVNVGYARSYARTVLERVTSGGQPISAALRNTGVPASTERAYIYVGTCSSRLAEPARGGAQDERRRAAEAAKILLDSRIALLAQFGASYGNPIHAALETLLRTEGTRFIEDFGRHWPAQDTDRLELDILELEALSREARWQRGLVEQPLRRIEDMKQVLASLQLDSKKRIALEARIKRLEAEILLLAGQSEQAIQVFEESIRAAESIGEAITAQALGLCDALRRLGRNKEALAWAAKADAAYGAQDGRAVARLGSLGRLAQISSALRDYDTALRYARQGLALAADTEELRERAEFKGDEARILHRMRRLDEASVAAQEFLDFARQAFDAPREMAAWGVLGQILIAKEQFEAAREHVQKGLAFARLLGIRRSVGDFLWDLAGIEEHAGNPEKAIDCALESAAIFSDLGEMPRIKYCLGFTTDQYAAIVLASPKRDTWNILSRILEINLSLLGRVDSTLATPIVIETVRALRDLVSRLGPLSLRDRIDGFARSAQSAATAAAGSKAFDHFAFTADLFSLFDDLSQSRFTEALQRGQRIDSRSDGAFGLAAFVAAQAGGGRQS